jgi:ATP-binding cassette subfamily C protein
MSQSELFRRNFKESFDLLGAKEKRKLFAILSFQTILGVFDLISIWLVGFIVTTTMNESSAGSSLEIDFLRQIENSEKLNFLLDPRVMVALVIFLLALKTYASIKLTKVTLNFFGNRATEISTTLFRKFFSSRIQKIKEYSTQEFIFASTRGVELLCLQVLATAMVMISDLVMVSLIGVTLILVDFKIAFFTIMLFASVTLVLNVVLGERSSKLGESNTRLGLESNNEIEELYNSYREIFVKKRLHFMIDKFYDTRERYRSTLSKIYFFPYVGKYVIESSLVIGGGLLLLFVFSSSNLVDALALAAMFLTAGSRIAPATLRIQQSYTSLRTYTGMITPTLDLIRKFDGLEEEISTVRVTETHQQANDDFFDPTVIIQDLKFAYQDDEDFRMDIDSLILPVGKLIAFVGPSGSGKSTLMDLILGLLDPKEGTIHISGVAPRNALVFWPGRIGYVPQDIHLLRGNLEENITLGFNRNEFTIEEVRSVIEAAGLRDDFETGALRNSSDSAKLNLSGGQRQRIGIARALLTEPRLIVLDEATSSLDAQTESIVMDTFSKFNEKRTILTVAHRLSTVTNADLVVYMENGRVISTGTFEEVRNSVPNFDVQASLMGL